MFGYDNKEGKNVHSPIKKTSEKLDCAKRVETSILNENDSFGESYACETVNTPNHEYDRFKDIVNDFYFSTLDYPDVSKPHRTEPSKIPENKSKPCASQKN